MIHILPATQDDTAALARVYVDTWRNQYAGILPATYLARMSLAEYQIKWAGYLNIPGTATYIAQTDKGEVIGFAHGGPARDKDLDYFAEIYLLYVAPHCQQRGVGRQLVASMAQQFVNIGLWSMAVWALRDNPSRGFYDVLGGERLAEKHVRVAGENYIEVAYGWRDIRPLTSAKGLASQRRQS
jgi:GNAT superfamily N-acetyltransferase